jgi:hypothetical protein
MKKIFSLLLLVSSLILFFWLLNYPNSLTFDYHTGQFVGYLFYWSFTLFLMSIFAWILDIKKYQKWVIFTVIYVILSILLAYRIGDGGSAIISIDGKLITLFLITLYSIISITYFIIQFVKNRKQTI